MAETSSSLNILDILKIFRLKGKRVSSAIHLLRILKLSAQICKSGNKLCRVLGVANYLMLLCEIL